MLMVYMSMDKGSGGTGDERINEVGIETHATGGCPKMRGGF